MKQIKLIKFDKPDKTIIGNVESYKLLGSDKIGTEDTKGKVYDIPRHADFQLAMDRLAPHLLIACGFREPRDANGNFLSQVYFNDLQFNENEEYENFGKSQVTSIHIKGADFLDGVILTGKYEAPDGNIVKITTPSICLLKAADGYNYPLIDILLPQIERLLTEANLYVSRLKHGAGVQTSLDLKKSVDTYLDERGQVVKRVDRMDDLEDQLEGVIEDRKNGSATGIKKEPKQTIKQAASNFKVIAAHDFDNED